MFGSGDFGDKPPWRFLKILKLPSFYSFILKFLKCIGAIYPKSPSQTSKHVITITNADDPNENCNFITEKFLNVLNIVNRHEPLKKKKLVGNQASFMTIEPTKEIYTRSRLENKYSRNPTKDNKAIYKKQINKCKIYIRSRLENKCNRNPTKYNKAIYKKQINKCKSLLRKAIKVYFNNVTKTRVQTNKNFWKLIKSFLTNKVFLENAEIILAEKDKIVTEEKEPVLSMTST